MFRTLTSLTQEHALWMVALAVLVCWVSNHTALRLIEQARSTLGQVRFGWESAAGFSIGAGVWSTHFIAMLGYDPGVIVGYDVERTLLSLALSVICAFIVVRLMRRVTSELSVLGIGALLGLGVAAMHYTGMTGVTIPGRFAWRADLVAASILVGLTLMPLALLVFARRLTVRPKLVAASLLTLGIATLHFTAMAAAEAVPDPGVDIESIGLPRVALAAAITAAMIVVLGSGVFALFAERLRASNRILKQRERELSAKTAELDLALAEARERERSLAVAREHAQRAEAQANTAHARLRDAIEILPEAIIIMDDERRVLLWNKRYAELYNDIADMLAPGVKFEHVLRTSLERGAYREEIADKESWLARRLERLADPRGPYEQRFRDGRWVRHEERRMKDGGTIGVRVDITDLKRREESFRQLFEANPVPMWVYDAATLCILAVNDAAVTHYGHSREHFLSLSVLDLKVPPERDAAKAALMGSLVPGAEGRPWRHVRADGDEINVLGFIKELPYQGRDARLLAAIDVTERARAEQRIAHMARHDPLTDLPNRLSFREVLEAACAKEADEASFAVHCLDLDRFKEVNDTLGHPIGDALLRAVTQRLRGCVGQRDVVARLGGDEFAILQMGVRSLEDARRLSRRVIRSLGAPYDICGHQVVIGASVGISTFPGDGTDPDALVRNADVALYASKANGRGTSSCFHAGMDEKLQHRRLIELELRKAVAAGDFVLHYQPIVDVATNEIVTFEALLHWLHPERGLVSPAEFVPVAEEIGLIVPIGEWVLREACAQAATWPGEIRVAVNLSPGQFRSKDLVATVMSSLAQSGLPAHRLELEITESALLDEGEATVRTLKTLRGLGVRVAMDDFGTGYSSLGHLRSFSFDKLKIDRSFVREMSTNADCAAIVRAVVQLAASLGIVATAEGVETEHQLRLIGAEGCREARGFHISHPLPAREAAAFIDGTMAQADAA